MHNVRKIFVGFDKLVLVIHFLRLFHANSDHGMSEFHKQQVLCCLVRPQ